MKKKFITNSEQETQQIAENFAKTLKGGEVVLLTGDLGAGKTVFVKAVAEELGVIRNVTSPTFVLMQTYSTSNKKIKTLCHIDAYRIDSEKDFKSAGLDEYLYRKDTVCFIEWGEKVKNALQKTIDIDIKIKDNERIITFKNIKKNL